MSGAALVGLHEHGLPLPPSAAPAQQLTFGGFGSTYRERLLFVERERLRTRREAEIGDRIRQLAKRKGGAT